MQYPNLTGEYRQLLNFGEIKANASLGSFNGINAAGASNGKQNIAGHLFARGRFTLDENWRAGFDINRATNDVYLRTFRFEYRRVLTTQFYVEGFWGSEGFARIDTRAYQGLRTQDDARVLPNVLPNAIYEYAPRETFLGGHLTMDASALGIARAIGSSSQRLATRLRWERSDIDPIGGHWTFRVQADGIGYNAQGQQRNPTLLPSANGLHDVGNIRAAIDWRMPFVHTGDWGSQLIEPRIQLVTGPSMGQQTSIPNDDSIDFEFSDANLFALNRYSGRDRQDGGSRIDMALRSAWSFPNGGQVEGVFGRSFRYGDLSNNAYALDGLARHGSDYVTRIRFQPVTWMEAIGRVRLDGENFTQRRAADGVINFSLGTVSLSAGYLFGPPVTFLSPYRSRDEVSAGLGARIGENWRLSLSGRYDLGIGRPVLVQGSLTYEDECFILETRFVKRFAQDPATNQIYPSNTVVLIRLGFKTIGEYFFRAI
jgi:LPS-assembly protein